MPTVSIPVFTKGQCLYDADAVIAYIDGFGSVLVIEQAEVGRKIMVVDADAVALVRGDHDWYRVVLYNAEDFDCSCPATVPVCAHVVAVRLEEINRAADEHDAGPIDVYDHRFMR